MVLPARAAFEFSGCFRPPDGASGSATKSSGSSGISCCKKKCLPCSRGCGKPCALGCRGDSSDVKQAYIKSPQSLRWFDSGYLQPFEQSEDVADPGQIDAVLARQRLDGLELHDIAARVAPAIGHGPLGADHVEVLVHHERPRMRLEDLRRDAKGEDRLVQIDARVVLRGAAGGCGRGLFFWLYEGLMCAGYSLFAGLVINFGGRTAS